MEINSNILEAIGLGLVHSLWQGAALLFVVLLGLVSLRNKKAKTRYTLVLMGILALPVLLAGNLYFFWPASPVENSGTLIASEIHPKTPKPHILNYSNQQMATRGQAAGYTRRQRLGVQDLFRADDPLPQDQYLQ